MAFLDKNGLSRLWAHIISKLNTNLDDAKTYTDTEVAKKADTSHTHNDIYYTETEIDEKLSGKSDTTHNHDSAYDIKGASDTALDAAREYTDTKTANLASNTSVNNKITTHNTSTTAHNDIRSLIAELTTKLNNFLDVDDATTDQLSEVITLINNNKGTLESLTTSKINVSDIVNNLETASTSKVLSANQGVTIKALIDTLQEAVDGKAASVHTHAISDVTNLQTSLDGKLPMDGTAVKAIGDANGNAIISTYETKTDSSSKLTESKTYTDTIAADKQDKFISVEVLETICENVVLTDDSPSHTFPTAINFVPNGLYVLEYAEYYNGDIIDKKTCMMKYYSSETDSINWLDSEYGINMTATMITDDWRSSGNISNISIKRINIIENNNLINFVQNIEGCNTVVGNMFSHAEGYETTASGIYSHAEGYRTTASGGHGAHAEGGQTTALGDYSHAEGSQTTALGDYSHAEGSNNIASGTASHAEGILAKASGEFSHAEGSQATASGQSSHAEGSQATASGIYSHAEGDRTTASGGRSHAEGSQTTALGDYSHAAGNSTNKYSGVTTSTDNTEIITAWGSNKFSLAKGKSSYVEGTDNLAIGDNSHAEGNQTTASGNTSHAEGRSTTASGDYSHAEGVGGTASNTASHAEGEYTTSSGTASHAEGSNTKATGNYSHAEGYVATASADYSHAEGYYTTASNNSSHAEGYKTTASGNYSHAEGEQATSSGKSSHAEGYKSRASGNYSHAEGYESRASGNYSHAEGYESRASADYSHAEGYGTSATTEAVYGHVEGVLTEAWGVASHAEGAYTEATGDYSHAEGYTTFANNFQHVCGKYNLSKVGPADEDTQDTSYSDALFIVGCGTSSTVKNGFRVTSAGKCYGAMAFGASGADFAELFEWEDGNPNDEDRRGLFITLEGEKIRLANADDDYIGVISGAQAFIGNSASEEWQGKYLTDVFGTPLSQEVEVPAEIDEETGKVIKEAYTTTQLVVNPDYDPNSEYVMRENRKEWGIVGLLGQVVVIDDGTCVVGGYVKPSINGIGTASNAGYRVMNRIDENHIKVLVR